MESSTNRETSVRTLERGLEVLHIFEAGPTELSLTEIAQEVGLSPSTASRLIAALEKHQFLRRNPDNRRYSLGTALLRLGDAAVRQSDIRSISLPFLRDLQRKYNESVSIYIAQGGRRVCLDRIESTQALRQSIIIGESLPLIRGAGGRVLLAWLSDTERHLILEQEACVLTEDDLAKVRREGYALSMEEREKGVFAVSAPIFNSHGKMIAALSMSGPTSRFNSDLEAEYIQAVQAHAQGVSRSLGYRS